MGITSFEGWSRCLRLEHGDLELTATLEVGPRILGFRTRTGENLLKVYDATRGAKGGTEYHSYGGHRLWRSPEIDGITNEPDNGEVELVEEGNRAILRPPLGAAGLRREVSIEAAGNGFLIRHTITNERPEPYEISSWGITVFRPGGECLIPQSPFLSWDEKLLPARPIVLWHYARMNDPRFTWGSRVIRLRQADAPATKFGAQVEQGIAAYAIDGQVFVKRFGFDPAATYPDFGCNFESYTREDMLEVEALGPVRWIEPGQSTGHSETWYLLDGETPPTDDEACGAWFDGIMRRCPHLG